MSNDSINTIFFVFNSKIQPKINNIRIMSTNPNVGEKVNTSKYDITKTSNGYLLRILPVLNEELKSTALRKLKARLHLPIRNSNSTVYFDSEYDINTGIFNFYIKFYIFVVYYI